jgi:CHAT domain-containing protein/tetratricopeptide (TPR) repeat protein
MRSGNRLPSSLLIALILTPSVAAGTPLSFGATRDEMLSAQQPRTLEVQAEAGTVLHLRIDHVHLNFEVQVLGPDQSVLGRESTLGSPEPVTLTVIAERSGLQQIEVRLRTPSSRAGTFHLALDPPHPATDRERLRIQAERLRFQADADSDSDEATRYVRGVSGYRSSLEKWKELGESFERAVTLFRLGELLEQMGRLDEARSVLEEALPLWRSTGDRSGESRCLDELAIVHSEQGDPRTGLELYAQALALRRSLGPHPYSEGRILNGMAIALSNLGDIPGSIARYTEALELARQDGDETTMAVALKNRAGQYIDLGEFDRGLDDLRLARAVFHRLGNRRREAVAEYQIGATMDDLHRTAEAWHSFQRALPMLEQTGNDRFAAIVLDRMGLVQLHAGRYREAASLLDEAIRRIEAGGDRRTAASFRLNRALVLAATGQPEQARASLLETLSQLRAMGDRSHEAIGLNHLAKVELDLNMLPEARDHIRASMQLAEETRAAIQSSSQRATWVAFSHGKDELLARILFALHAREPGRGWDAAALEVSEAGRARALRELLATARVDLRSGVDPSLLAAEKELDRRAENARRSLLTVLGRSHTTEEADAIQRELDAVRTEREQLEARMRASSPRYGAQAPGPPLSLFDIREQVLDDSTALVEYLVGEEQSFVWVVSRNGLTAARLPGRARITRAVDAVIRRWSDPAALDNAQESSAALSRMVLGPVAPVLRGKTLLLVADGPLLRVPFGALPEPGRGGVVLEHHTLVSLPSASVVPLLRSGRSGPREPGPELAVLADPVLGPARPSSSGSQEVATLTPLVRSLEDAGLRHLEPLPGSRREALAIASHLPPERVLTAFGADASRSTALGEEVSRARILHFATHALLDERRPELSGIVVSERAPDGSVRSGFLSLADISALRLSAELVVLSACRTGLGKDVRGEGLVGLTRGFMNAGAPRVVASLWKVTDAATAELMERFYTLMLDRKLAPAEALRQAQRSLRKDRQTSAPHAWAGFVLSGDWRPLGEASASEMRPLP